MFTDTEGDCVKVAVFAADIFDQMLPSIDPCHWIFPRLPATDTIIELPEQIMAGVVNVTVPERDGWSTETMTGFDVAEPHGLFVILTLYVDVTTGDTVKVSPDTVVHVTPLSELHSRTDVATLLV